MRRGHVIVDCACVLVAGDTREDTRDAIDSDLENHGITIVHSIILLYLVRDALAVCETTRVPCRTVAMLAASATGILVILVILVIVLVGISVIVTIVIVTIVTIVTIVIVGALERSGNDPHEKDDQKYASKNQSCHD